MFIVPIVPIGQLCSYCSLCSFYFVNCVIGLRVYCTHGTHCIDSALGIHCDHVAQVFNVFKEYNEIKVLKSSLS